MRWKDRFNDRGEADPVVVLVSLVVAVLVAAGVALTVVGALQWSRVFAADAGEQTREDAARLSWMADVGTATAVVPGPDAATQVRFDSTDVTSGWPAGAACRAVTWTLSDAVADPAGPNAYDPVTGELREVVNAHRQVDYYAAATGGACETAGAPVAAGRAGVALANVLPGAQVTYRNAYARELTFTGGVEGCEGITAGDVGALQACTGGGRPDGLTWWEWADPAPVQVSLEMMADQAGMGYAFATQVGWREVAGRVEMAASSPLPDTLDDPTQPEGVGAPLVDKVEMLSPDDPTLDRVTITRTDTRDADGFEFRCEVRELGSPTGWIGPVDLDGENLAVTATTTVPGTAPGMSYECAQRAWVMNVDQSRPALGAEAGWSATDQVTRRPAPPVFTRHEITAGTTAAFTWTAMPGAAGYDLQRWSGSGWVPLVDTTWSGPVSWESEPLGPGGGARVRVRSFNDGGVSPWVESSASDLSAAVTLAPVPGATTRSLAATVTVTSPNPVTVRTRLVTAAGAAIAGPNGQWAVGATRTFDPLTHGTTYRLQTEVTDPFGQVIDADAARATTATLAGTSTLAPTAGAQTHRLSAAVTATPAGTVSTRLVRGATQAHGWATGSARTFTALEHNVTYTLQATVTDGHNTVGVPDRAATTWRLDLTQAFSAVTSRSFTTTASTTAGVSGLVVRTRLLNEAQTVELAAWANGTVRTFDGLTHGTRVVSQAQVTDGHNTVTIQNGVTLDVVGSPAGCWIDPATGTITTTPQTVSVYVPQSPGLPGPAGVRVSLTGSGGVWHLGTESGGHIVTSTFAPAGTTVDAYAWWTDGVNFGAPQFCGIVQVTTATTVPPAPGITSATWRPTVGLDTTINRITVNPAPVSGATMYQARLAYTTILGPSDWFNQQAVTAGTVNTIAACISAPAVVTAVNVQVRAGNSSGWSAWTSVSVPRGTALPGCA